MSVVVSQNGVFELPGNRELPRFRWTRTQYHQLVETGFITQDRSCELIEGEIIPHMPQGRLHALTIMLVLALLQEVYGRGTVQPQLPIAIDDNNELEPDLSVLNAPASNFVRDHPGPANVILLVEVSLSTLGLDRNAKSNVYARAGVAEYWIIDVVARRVTVRRDPSQEGYRTSFTLDETQAIAPLSAPTSLLAVADMLPPVDVQ